MKNMHGDLVDLYKQVLDDNTVDSAVKALANEKKTKLETVLEMWHACLCGVMVACIAIRCCIRSHDTA